MFRSTIPVFHGKLLGALTFDQLDKSSARVGSKILIVRFIIFLQSNGEQVGRLSGGKLLHVLELPSDGS